ncbi:HpcH/HpaI aldolase/citrate lyase family protein [Micromonospora yangpuensis]|uniref:Citrate lyase subunit beta / citryl-CoA lyase n=1 Tax=Micromonospora yangpuensis TaxID=683228 RepID=A0A1C6UPH1_9ACTN|nr:CoA ester lyase [Micromonospora yangpuensis]GGM08333.1 CoA ester lyase [Micromonospora yangpuensis]SCL55931.1 citrate lyase subunit beta / citryl-CoA lyase [Micromonospora yangpuensis]
MLPRSWLYVPGHRERMLARALTSDADALIADLEDGVAAAERPQARELLTRWLGDRPVDGPAVWVRVCPSALDEDLDAVVRPGLDGIVVAKVDDAELLHRVDATLTRLEQERGLPVGRIAVSPRVESARGLRRIDAIAAAPRMLLLGLGEADLVADLGLRPGPDGLELLPARFEVVAASAAAGLAAPVGPASVNYRDLDRLRAETTALRHLGFGGRTAIHPAQLPVINEVFTPSADEVAAAERVLAAYAAGDGGAVAVAGTGTMVDEAVARSARAVLARARR